jgi:uncharacterized membrane protein
VLFGGAHAGSVFVAAFLASLVEFVEALTIVLAVGTVRGWRSSLLGAALGATLLIALVLLLGPSLGMIPITWLQLSVGVLLLLFGIRWLRKAILRGAGVIALHDEAQAYEKETAELRRAGAARIDGIDLIATTASFKAVVLEGLEVVFIVIAVGAAGRMLVPAGIGAGAALAVVLLLGVILHRPLTKVPENALKLVVGVMVSAFGLFWIGEGLGNPWPGGDWSIPALGLGLLALALAMIAWLRNRLAKAAVPP